MIRWMAVVSFGLTVTGCGGAPRICAPGATQLCFCTGGVHGSQTCAANGESWGTCDCGHGPTADLGGADQGMATDAMLVPKKQGPVFLDQALVKPTDPSCSDHLSEPNNTAATATELISEGLITGWEICYMFDIDQYRIRIQDSKVGQTLYIKVEFSHDRDGDAEAALMDPNGRMISVSRSDTNNEMVSTATGGLIKGDYILGVWSSCCDQTTSQNTSGAGIKYDLNITIQ